MGMEGKPGGGVQFCLLFEIHPMIALLPFASVCPVSQSMCPEFLQFFELPLATGFSDSFYKVCCLFGMSLEALTGYRSFPSYQEMVAHYSKGSDNCSTQPLWGINTGGACIIICEKSLGSWLILLAGFRPDVYFRPHEVWEIRGAE